MCMKALAGLFGGGGSKAAPAPAPTPAQAVQQRTGNEASTSVVVGSGDLSGKDGRVRSGVGGDDLRKRGVPGLGL